MQNLISRMKRKFLLFSKTSDSVIHTEMKISSVEKQPVLNSYSATIRLPLEIKLALVFPYYFTACNAEIKCQSISLQHK